MRENGETERENAMNNRYMEQILGEINHYHDRKLCLNREIRELHKGNRTRETNKRISRMNSELIGMRRPVSFGKECAAKAWLRGKKYAQPDEPVLDKIGITWISDFLETLKEADVRSFFFQGGGINGFEAMLTFMDFGCKFYGFETKESFSPELNNNEKTIRGVRFLIK